MPSRCSHTHKKRKSKALSKNRTLLSTEKGGLGEKEVASKFPAGAVSAINKLIHFSLAIRARVKVGLQTPVPNSIRFTDIQGLTHVEKCARQKEDKSERAASGSSSVSHSSQQEMTIKSHLKRKSTEP